MIDTAIYISVTRGKDALVLDGDLYLFGELLITLQRVAHELPELSPKSIATPTIDDPKQGGNHVTD